MEKLNMGFKSLKVRRQNEFKGAKGIGCEFLVLYIMEELD